MPDDDDDIVQLVVSRTQLRLIEMQLPFGIRVAGPIPKGEDDDDLDSYILQPTRKAMRR